MHRLIGAPLIAPLICASATAFAGSSDDFDMDGIVDWQDNCSETPNAAQDDTDMDFCGNYCDADFDQNGIVGIADFSRCFVPFFNTSNNQLCCLVGIIPNCVLGVDDFGAFGSMFNTVPGPSGTTPGTIACP